MESEQAKVKQAKVKKERKPRLSTTGEKLPPPAWVQAVKSVCAEKLMRYTIPKKGTELHDECVKQMLKNRRKSTD